MYSINEIHGILHEELAVCDSFEEARWEAILSSYSDVPIAIYNDADDIVAIVYMQTVFVKEIQVCVTQFSTKEENENDIRT
jgi:hypothetical protein